MFGICTMLFGVRLGQAIDSDEMERSRVVALIGFMALAYQIDVTETIFMRSTSSIATLILACAFNAAPPCTTAACTSPERSESDSCAADPARRNWI